MWLVLLGCGPKLTIGSTGRGPGEECTGDQCANGLVCDHDGVCAEEGEVGTGVEGDDCSASLECGWGLVCSGANECVPAGSAGTGTEGDTCATDLDCQAGHYCVDGVCVDGGIPWWDGATCPPDEETAPYFYALFDVPDIPVSGEIDFYALPFPNDARLGTDGFVDLSGHPSPGAVAPQVDALLDAIEAEATGFGTNPTVFFRFNRKQDNTSLTALTDGATIQFVSLDEDAPDYGPRASLTFRTSTSRGKYICQNWVGVSVYDGEPLEPGHTYAVWLTRGVTDREGAPLTRDDGFKLMMQADRPKDLMNGRAHDAYAPLRDYLDREGLPADDVAVAAVFTTADPASRVRWFREMAQSAGVTDTALLRCDEGVTSPCFDHGERACVAADPAFHELHGRIAVPEYRDGTGAVTYDAATFRPIQAGTTEACFALTVPPGEPPSDGWPVAVVQPDAGRTFRAAVEDGIASALAARGYATFTLELPDQGERGDGVLLDATTPLALRGNLLQAIADPHAAETWLRSVTLDAAASPTGAALRFDADHLWFWGEGFGASSGMGYLAWAQGAEGGVLGNPEGHLLHKLSGQLTPVALAHELDATLADTALSPFHPLLNLLQLHYEGADAVNHGPKVVRDPGLDARHLVVIDGVDDPDLVRDGVRAAARSLSIPLAGAELDAYGLSTTGFPVQDNVSTDDGRRTAAIVQYAADRTAIHVEAQGQCAAFLASALEGVPTLEE